MIARWCISVLIFSVTLFGAVSQHQTVTPNQEIVLQFQDVDLTSKQTENTVATIKQQLQSLGAQNIQVLALESGKLKITYFSNADIASIKQTFNEEQALALQISSESKNQDSSNFPFENAQVSYNLDVYEIQDAHSSGWGFDGAISLEVELKSDRFLDPNNLSIENIECQYQENLIQVAYKICTEVALKIGSPLHTIPEVRAGPFS